MAEHGNQANDSGRPVLQLRLRTLLIWVAVVATVLGSVMVLTTAVERAREAAARNHCSLGQIALACRNYHDQHGELPPAIVYGQRGEPLYSWRVLILPCLEQQTLYDEFRLDEPWDSEHNIHLLERMPSSFAAPWTRRVDVPPGHTVCRVLVGPGTAFEERRRLRLADDFPDGTRKTLLFVEAGKPVPWTKPEALPYDPTQPLHLEGLFREGFRACTVDGGYRFIRYDADQESVHAMITRNGGEDVPLEW